MGGQFELEIQAPLLFFRVDLLVHPSAHILIDDNRAEDAVEAGTGCNDARPVTVRAEDPQDDCPQRVDEGEGRQRERLAKVEEVLEDTGDRSLTGERLEVEQEGERGELRNCGAAGASACSEGEVRVLGARLRSQSWSRQSRERAGLDTTAR